jgi:hypothetical protein
MLFGNGYLRIVIKSRRERWGPAAFGADENLWGIASLALKRQASMWAPVVKPRVGVFVPTSSFLRRHLSWGWEEG